MINSICNGIYYGRWESQNGAWGRTAHVYKTSDGRVVPNREFINKFGEDEYKRVYKMLNI